MQIHILVGRISKSGTSKPGTVVLAGREWASGWVNATRWASESELETCFIELNLGDILVII